MMDDKNYLDIQSFFGVHPNEYADMLIKQKNILYLELRSLYTEGLYPEIRLKAMDKQLSMLLYKTLPHLCPPHIKQDE